MNINSQMMARLAALSKLELSQEELEQLSSELETIVDYMDILSQFPTEHTDCEVQNTPLHILFREDRVIGSYNRAELLSNAPETNGVTLTVPKTVE